MRKEGNDHYFVSVFLFGGRGRGDSGGCGRKTCSRGTGHTVEFQGTSRWRNVTMAKNTVAVIMAIFFLGTLYWRKSLYEILFVTGYTLQTPLTFLGGLEQFPNKGYKDKDSKAICVVCQYFELCTL